MLNAPSSFVVPNHLVPEFSLRFPPPTLCLAAEIRFVPGAYPRGINNAIPPLLQTSLRDARPQDTVLNLQILGDDFQGAVRGNVVA